MDGALAWARADLERATRLYERARTTHRALDERWESEEHTWRLRVWREKRKASGRRLWDATLTAYGVDGSIWSFSWSNDGWLTVRGAGSVWSFVWPDDMVDG